MRLPCVPTDQACFDRHPLASTLRQNLANAHTDQDRLNAYFAVTTTGTLVWAECETPEAIDLHLRGLTNSTAATCTLAAAGSPEAFLTAALHNDEAAITKIWSDTEIYLTKPQTPR